MKHSPKTGNARSVTSGPEAENPAKETNKREELSSIKARITIGNILVVLAAAFTVYLSVIMIQRINAVVLRDSYVDLFRYEVIACVFFLLFSLDVRFGFFTKMKPVALISSNYHMDRAVQTANSAGFREVLRRPAPSSFLYFGSNLMGEVILELNELTLKK